MPLISVVLSTFNDEVYIQEAVESILNQTIKDIELIIINDGSTDQTASILNQFTDPRIIRIDHESSQTLPVSLNEGLALTQGEFIARMDGDDISHPNRFEAQLDYFSKHPDVDVLGTQIKMLEVKTGRLLKKSYPTAHSMIVWYLFMGHALAHPSIMMRRRVMKLRQPLYNPDYQYSQDFELWHFLLDKVRFANLPDQLLTYRLHSKSATRIKPTEWRTKNYRPALDSILSLTGQEVDIKVARRLMYHQIERNIFDKKQVDESMVLVLMLYHALISQGLIDEQDKAHVQSDMIERITQLSRRSPSLDHIMLRGFGYMIESIMPKRLYNIWRSYILGKA